MMRSPGQTTRLDPRLYALGGSVFAVGIPALRRGGVTCENDEGGGEAGR